MTERVTVYSFTLVRNGHAQRPLALVSLIFDLPSCNTTLYYHRDV